MDPGNGQDHFSSEQYPPSSLPSHQIPLQPPMPSQLSDHPYQSQPQSFLPDGSVGGEYHEVYQSPERSNSLPQLSAPSPGYGQQQQQHASSAHTTPGAQPLGLPASRSSTDPHSVSIQYVNAESNLQSTHFSPQVHYSPMTGGVFNSGHNPAVPDPSREIPTHYNQPPNSSQDGYPNHYPLQAPQSQHLTEPHQGLSYAQGAPHYPSGSLPGESSLVGTNHYGDTNTGASSPVTPSSIHSALSQGHGPPTHGVPRTMSFDRGHVVQPHHHHQQGHPYNHHAPSHEYVTGESYGISQGPIPGAAGEGHQVQYAPATLPPYTQPQQQPQSHVLAQGSPTAELRYPSHAIPPQPHPLQQQQQQQQQVQQHHAAVEYASPLTPGSTDGGLHYSGLSGAGVNPGDGTNASSTAPTPPAHPHPTINTNVHAQPSYHHPVHQQLPTASSVSSVSTNTASVPPSAGSVLSTPGLISPSNSFPGSASSFHNPHGLGGQPSYTPTFDQMHTHRAPRTSTSSAHSNHSAHSSISTNVDNDNSSVDGASAGGTGSAVETTPARPSAESGGAGPSRRTKGSASAATPGSSPVKSGRGRGRPRKNASEDYSDDVANELMDAVDPDDAEQRKEDARTQRMNAEQKRRDLLRDGYDRLQSVLPQAREKLSKVKLIEAATHHIVRLTNEQEDRSARLSRLIAERDELQRRNEIISQALSTNSPIPSDVMEPLPQDPVAHGNHVPKDSGPSGTGPPSRGHGSSSGSGLNLTPAAHRPVPISASGRSSRRFEGSASDASGSGVGYTNGGGATKAESKGGDLLDDEMSDL